MAYLVIHKFVYFLLCADSGFSFNPIIPLTESKKTNYSCIFANLQFSLYLLEEDVLRLKKTTQRNIKIRNFHSCAESDCKYLGTVMKLKKR